MLETLLEGTFGECADSAEDYVNRCHKLFPLARVFTTKDDLQQKINGEENPSQQEVDPICDGEV